jgi:hypothetical protein
VQLPTLASGTTFDFPPLGSGGYVATVARLSQRVGYPSLTQRVGITRQRLRLNKFHAKQRTPLVLVERMYDQAAEQLGIEVGALGWHAFVVQTDASNVVDTGRHDQSCKRIFECPF